MADDFVRRIAAPDLAALLAEQPPDTLNELLQFVLRAATQAQFDEQIGAAPFERSRERRGWRISSPGALQLGPRDYRGRAKVGPVFRRDLREQRPLFLAGASKNHSSALLESDSVLTHPHREHTGGPTPPSLSDHAAALANLYPEVGIT